jgi:hypothetical protein
MIAGHRDSTVEKYKPALVLSSQLEVSLWLFEITEVNPLTLGGPLRDSNRLGCAHTCSFGLGIRVGMSRTPGLRAASKQPKSACEHCE